MVHNDCFYVVKDIVTVLNICNLAETVSDWHLYAFKDVHILARHENKSMNRSHHHCKGKRKENKINNKTQIKQIARHKI